MERTELLEQLRHFSPLADFDASSVVELPGAGVTPHALRIDCAGQSFFVKEVLPREAKTLRTIAPLRLKHVIEPLSTELLDRNILVTRFCASGTIRTRELEPELIQDMAELQNRLVPQGWSKAPSDTRFYEESLLRSYDEAEETVTRLVREQCPVAARLADILESLVKRKERVAHAYGSMPFGWMHNDFREENILRGPPQLVADWGSCFGMGPFLHDLGPFLLGSIQRLQVFATRSRICRESTSEQIRRWVHIAAQARFVNLLRYLDEYYCAELHSPATRDEFLQYHVRTYALLLERQPTGPRMVLGQP